MELNLGKFLKNDKKPISPIEFMETDEPVAESPIGFIEKDTGCYGMRDDVLYLIDGVSENDTSYELVTITADGNMTRTAVQ